MFLLWTHSLFDLPLPLPCLLYQNKHLPKIFEWVAAHGADPIIPFSGAFENEVWVGAVPHSFRRQRSEAEARDHIIWLFYVIALSPKQCY